MSIRKKTKAEKRRIRSRRTILLNIDTDALEEHFCNIVSIIRAEVRRQKDDDSNDIAMLMDLAAHCVLGWNCAVNCGSREEAEQCIDDCFADDDDDSKPVLDIVSPTSALKKS